MAQSIELNMHSSSSKLPLVADHEDVSANGPSKAGQSSTGKRSIPRDASLLQQVTERPLYSLAQIACAIGMGVLFGVLLQKSRVFEVAVIRDQMLLERFLMMKMFLSAAVGGTCYAQCCGGLTPRLVADPSGMCVFIALSLLPFERVQARFASTRTYTTSTTLSYPTIVVGGVLLGAGMTVSGACPGMVLAQVGSGSPNSLYTVLGGIAGAAIYALLQPRLPFDAHTLFVDGAEPTRELLDEKLGRSYATVATPVLLALMAVIAALEFFFPWTDEVPPQPTTGLQWSAYAWNPIISGLFIGLLQLPGLLVLERSLGCSSSYVTIVANLLRFDSSLTRNCSLLQMKRNGIGNWWQVLYVLSAVLGALLASRASDTYGDVEGVTPLAGFVGGFILIGGARLAGGCTSGHGLSGFGLLNLRSVVAVAAMFAGGLGSAFPLQALDLI